MKFEQNRINTTSEEWNLKFGFQISLFMSGIYEVEFKFDELLVVFPMNTMGGVWGRGGAPGGRGLLSSSQLSNTILNQNIVL